MITATEWLSERISIAGAQGSYLEPARQKLGCDHMAADAIESDRRAAHLMLGS